MSYIISEVKLNGMECGTHPHFTSASRPVYTGDFCRGNSMQFLSRLSCNFKIARVNQVQFSLRFVAAISQGFRTCLKLDATLVRQTLHRVAATKIACVNVPLEQYHRPTCKSVHCDTKNKIKNHAVD